MNKETQVLKDEENQQAIPLLWRRPLQEIVEALKQENFQLAGIREARRLSPSDAQRIARNIENYGAHLRSLPEEAWQTSVCQWMREYWDALIDLYTLEEGVSDLVLSVRVYEIPDGYEFDVQSVHVP
ncbi:hypothetical protein NRY95_15825 [Xanthomonas campestris pv. phormiicola]|nr:hypothetical protein [Xanthomonas campestris pv. phormiicola]UYC15186.1 hypothetical protein NRY95_15825 [Xanthomonas campestris pv. phormiicola]